MELSHFQVAEVRFRTECLNLPEHDILGLVHFTDMSGELMTCVGSQVEIRHMSRGLTDVVKPDSRKTWGSN